MGDHEMGMLFAFPDGSASFVNGFEAGMIWYEIDELGSASIDKGFETGFPIHAENLELVRRMAASRNYRVEVGTEADGWVPVRLIWVGAGNAKPILRAVP